MLEDYSGAEGMILAREVYANILQFLLPESCHAGYSRYTKSQARICAKAIRTSFSPFRTLPCMSYCRLIATESNLTWHVTCGAYVFDTFHSMRPTSLTGGKKFIIGYEIGPQVVAKFRQQSSPPPTKVNIRRS